MISFAIRNFGCRVNQAEAFSWAEELQGNGLLLEKDSSRSDLVFVNTCTLTGSADRDVRKFLRRMSQANPGAKLVVTGCTVDRSGEEFRKNPQVWLLIPNREKDGLARRVLSLLGEQRREAGVLSFRSRGLLKVQDGCDFSCSFCVIPQVRGRSASVPKAEVLGLVRRRIGRGFREIVLAGIHLSSYGRDLEPPSSLLELLREIEAEEGLGKARLSSLDPRFMTEDLVTFLTQSRKVCPHFHLSLQSGCDRILGLMGRRSCAAEYARILKSLCRNSADVALGADIIAGFPGETEEDFEKTYRFLENSPLSYFHVFSYSPRPGTRAADFGQVDGKVKKLRAARLRALSREKFQAFRRRFQGRELDGIVIERRSGGAEVLTANYLQVFIPECGYQESAEIKVRINDACGEITRGELIS